VTTTTPAEAGSTTGPTSGSAAAQCLADVEALAAGALPAAVRDFVAGGSGAELTVAANRAAWDGVRLEPRVLRDAAAARTGADLLGRPAALPVAVAPMAYQRLLHPDGELATARAAAAAGIPFAVSTLSSVPVEELTAAGGDVWFQLYWLRDRAATFDLVARAEAAGCRALVLTADVPWMGTRLRDVRNEFALPPEVRAAHFDPAPGSAGAAAHRAGSGASALATHTALAFDPALTWSDVAELRERTRLPLVVKGVLAPEDARRAAECGADAVVVSNHGGRQLDGVVTAAERITAVRDAVPGSCQVLADSGIRGGVDVLKALALGAAGVLLGRPVLWGLALGGESGVTRVLDLLSAELRDALGLAGCAGPADARALRVFPTPKGTGS
jgi:4-hydroxymandelate oxidase